MRMSADQDSRQNAVMECKTDLEQYAVPEEAVAVVAGIDMQQAGFWYRLRAFAPDGTGWGITEGMAATWEDLDRILFETVYQCSDGRIFHVWRACIDTGGTKAAEAFVSRTEEAYQWIATRRGRNGIKIYPCKGSSAAMATKINVGKALERTPSGKPIPGCRFHWRP
jgi:phage terminase large subunit GpA-like protein